MKSDALVTSLLLLALLVAASLLNGVAWKFAGRNVRPEHLAAVLAFAAFVVTQFLRRESVIRADVFSVLAVAWVGVNALSSWLYAPQPSTSAVHVFRLGLLALVLLMVANLPFRRAGHWLRGFQIWFSLGLLAVGYGLFVWILASYGDIWLTGAFQDPMIYGPSIKGTQLERNFYGILAGTLLCVACYSVLAERREHVVAPTGFLVAACVLAATCVIISLTRSAWLAVVTAGPLGYVLFDRRRLGRADRPLLQTVVALPVLVGTLFGAVQLLPAQARLAQPLPTAALPSAVVGERLSTFSDLGSDRTVNTRIQDAVWALRDWQASPVLGRGTGSFLQIHGVREGTEAWISNLVLHTMVDTGIVGLAIQMSLFALVAWRTWLAASATAERPLEIGLKAMTLGFLVMVIAYQFTDGTWLAAFWVHLGLMVNGIYCVREEQRRADLLQGRAP
jgi:O-antigen ligase